MGALRILLVLLFLWILGYTAIVVANHGLGVFEVFFRDLAAMGWPGQFNADFMSYLTLSAVWLAWRHQFSPAGIAMGVLGFFGGALVLTVYLFVASLSANGDLKVLLLGRERARS